MTILIAFAVFALVAGHTASIVFSLMAFFATILLMEILMRRGDEDRIKRRFHNDNARRTGGIRIVSRSEYYVLWVISHTRALIRKMKCIR